MFHGNESTPNNRGAVGNDVSYAVRANGYITRTPVRLQLVSRKQVYEAKTRRFG
jgi:hypothetical protein